MRDMKWGYVWTSGMQNEPQASPLFIILSFGKYDQGIWITAGQFTIFRLQRPKFCDTHRMEQVRIMAPIQSTWHSSLNFKTSWQKSHFMHRIHFCWKRTSIWVKKGQWINSYINTNHDLAQCKSKWNPCHQGPSWHGRRIKALVLAWPRCLQLNFEVHACKWNRHKINEWYWMSVNMFIVTGSYSQHRMLRAQCSMASEIAVTPYNASCLRIGWHLTCCWCAGKLLIAILTKHWWVEHALSPRLGMDFGLGFYYTCGTFLCRYVSLLLGRMRDRTYSQKLHKQKTTGNLDVGRIWFPDFCWYMNPWIFFVYMLNIAGPTDQYLVWTWTRQPDHSLPSLSSQTRSPVQDWACLAPTANLDNTPSFSVVWTRQRTLHDLDKIGLLYPASPAGSALSHCDFYQSVWN